MTNGESHSIFDPAFWVAAAFLVLVVLIFRPLRRLITQGLDGRAQEIAKELEQARTLREEAQSTLAAYQRRQQEVEKEAGIILKKAREEAQNLSQDAHDKLEKALNQRMELAEKKIARAEELALKEMYNHSIDAGIEAARQYMLSHLTKEQSKTLMQDSLRDIGKRFH